jgi:hypothetical protein
MRGRRTTGWWDIRELKANAGLAAIGSAWTINVGVDAECETG